MTTQKLLYPLEGDALGDQLCEVEAGYQRYFTKTGAFSKSQLWSRRDANGVVHPTNLTSTYMFFESHGASVDPCACDLAINNTG